MLNLIQEKRLGRFHLRDILTGLSGASAGTAAGVCTTCIIGIGIYATLGGVFTPAIDSMDTIHG
ncbi:hypothetical protein KIU71_04565 [Alteromonas sp. SM 2104]|nr:hypothetical protein [Alteromonas oceanisediminis]